jgi:hypothetical protein
MKDFLKTLGRGLAVIFTSFIVVATTACSCIDLFVELPTKTGLAAVGLFIFALIRLLIGIGLTYVLGEMTNHE